MGTDTDIDWHEYDGEFKTDSWTTRFLTKLIGDENEIHQSDEAAQEAGFDKQVIAGVHTIGWVSQALADYGDGTTVLVGFEEIMFTHPIYVDDDIELEYGISEPLHDDEDRLLFRVNKKLGDHYVTCVDGVARVTHV